MSQQRTSPITLQAAEDLVAFRRVTISGSTIVYADAEHRGIGVVQAAVDYSENASACIKLDNDGGTSKMMAGGAISAGADVYAADDGKVAATGSVALGRALEAATADGDIIEVLPLADLSQAGGAEAEVTGGSGGITAVDLVYVSDQTAGAMTVLKAQATSGGRFADYICPQAIAAAATGQALKVYLLQGIDTSAGSVGDPVYLADGAAGGYTLTKPTATDKVQIVGRIVEDHATTGAILFDLSGPQQVEHDHSSAAEGGSTLGAHGSGTITLADEANLVANTNIGSRIGTATGQKIGFWNATPVVQQSHIADPASAAAQTQDTLTDNGGGTADQTVASMAAPTTITDSTGLDGTHDDTLAATAALVTLTDSTGLDGTHDDTLAASTVPTTLTDSTGLNGTHDDTLAATAALVTLTDSTGLDGTHDDTVAAVVDIDTLTDSTGGAVDNTVAANASVSVFAIPIADMVKLANGDVVTEFVPGFAGTILKTFWIQEDPVTTADKLATLNLEIETTNVAGGVVSLTSAACTPMGKVIDGSAVTGDNVFTAAQKISVEASSVTAFIEGTGTLYLIVSNDAVDDNFKEVTDQLITQKTLNGVVAQNVSDLTQKVIELVTRVGVLGQNASDTGQKVIEHNALLGVLAQNASDTGQKAIELVTRVGVLGQNISDLGQKLIEIVTWMGTVQNNMKEVTTELAKIKTDVAAVRTGSEANNTALDSINAVLAATGITAAS
jgi:hypothetical protein